MYKFFTTDTLLWFARMVLVAVGGALVSRGYVDNETWVQVTAGVLTAAGSIWSYLARKQALAATPEG